MKGCVHALLVVLSFVVVTVNANEPPPAAQADTAARQVVEKPVTVPDSTEPAGVVNQEKNDEQQSLEKVLQENIKKEGTVQSTVQPVTASSADTTNNLSKRPVRIGAYAGIVGGNIHTTPYAETDPNTGFAIGPALEVPLGDSLSWEIQFMAAQYGYKQRTAGIKVDYFAFDIPILLKSNFDLSPKTAAFFSFGPSLLIRHSKTYAEAGSTIMDITDDVDGVMVNLVIGAGLDFQISDTYHGIITMRYVGGIRNVDRTGASITTNSSFVLLFGLMQDL